MKPPHRDSQLCQPISDGELNVGFPCLPMQCHWSVLIESIDFVIADTLHPYILSVVSISIMWLRLCYPECLDRYLFHSMSIRCWDLFMIYAQIWLPTIASKYHCYMKWHWCYIGFVNASCLSENVINHINLQSCNVCTRYFWLLVFSWWQSICPNQCVHQHYG